MAAGLGFKTFNTGDVLSASDTNGYLMQGVLVFASSAARDAAITSPQEGQFAYLKDTNVTTYYTGSAWANLDTTGMTNPMTTTGDTIYSSSGSTPARLGIGTSGQVLTVSGGGVPSWVTPASSLPASASNVITTSQAVTSQSYTDLATVGPSVTLTTGTRVLVIIASHVNTGGSNNNAIISFGVSGATSISANDEWACVFPEYGGNENMRLSMATRQNVTAGSNTFTMKYRSKNNTQVTYKNREIIVVDIGA